VVTAPSESARSDRFDALLDAAVDAMILIDRVGTITRFNPAAERLFGYSEADVVGSNVRMLMPQPYRDEHDGYVSRYVQTGRSASSESAAKSSPVGATAASFPSNCRSANFAAVPKTVSSASCAMCPSATCWTPDCAERPKSSAC
jgi:PAS domain S-box-containing protein